MTPEERFTRIENALEALTESQARHDTQIRDLIAETEKQNAGIRDLVVLSRTFLESLQDHDLRLKKLEESQESTNQTIERLFEKIDRLIDDIDKFRRPGPNENI